MKWDFFKVHVQAQYWWECVCSACLADLLKHILTLIGKAKAFLLKNWRAEANLAPALQMHKALWQRDKCGSAAQTVFLSAKHNPSVWGSLWEGQSGANGGREFASFHINLQHWFTAWAQSLQEGETLKPLLRLMKLKGYLETSERVILLLGKSWKKHLLSMLFLCKKVCASWFETSSEGFLHASKNINVKCTFKHTESGEGHLVWDITEQWLLRFLLNKGLVNRGQGLGQGQGQHCI